MHKKSYLGWQFSVWILMVYCFVSGVQLISVDAVDKKKSTTHNPSCHSARVDSGPGSSVEKTVQDLTVLSPIQTETSAQCFGDEKMNFGVVIYNRYFQFYRSKGLNLKGMKQLGELLDKNELNCPRKDIYLNSSGFKKDGFAAQEKALFDGQHSLYAERGLADSEGYCMARGRPLSRPTGTPPPVNKDTRFVYGLTYLEGDGSSLGDKTRFLKAKKFPEQDETSLGGRDSFYRVLDEMLSTDGAVRFHCKGGNHRTGMAALMLRELQGGDWTEDVQTEEQDPIKARRELSIKIPFREKYLRIQGAIKFDFKPANRAQLEYFNHNKEKFRQENLESVAVLRQDHRFQCLKDKFKCYLNDTDPKPKIKSCYQNEENFKKEGCDARRMLSPSSFTEEKRREFLQECQTLYGQETVAHVALDHAQDLFNKQKKDAQKFLDDARHAIVDYMNRLMLSGRMSPEQIKSATGNVIGRYCQLQLKNLPNQQPSKDVRQLCDTRL